MEVYEVIATNLDCKDGDFVNALFLDIEQAKVFCQEEISNKSPKNVTLDFEGKLGIFDGKSLNYAPSSNKPAIYYNSHFGNYRCVVYIKTRKVH